MYKFFSKYLNYHNVSIRYPHRIEDGYGLKTKHLDIMKDEGISLVITVDNGITSIAEAEYAKTLGMDLIITDHHQALDELPDAYAVINPQVSSRYPFKGLA
ncbi:DHH family phosphoesterase [bacterium]|nr:DHH family phosphoesterase [bacterium]